MSQDYKNGNYITQDNNHIQIKIEHSAKGARVHVTVDRQDHDINKAVDQAVKAYITAKTTLRANDQRVDDL